MASQFCSESAGVIVSCRGAAALDVEALDVEALDVEMVFGDRMARILDPSINQLFSVTMRLTAVATEQADPRTTDRLLRAVQEIDDAIRRIRADLIAELVASPAACEVEHVSWG